MAKDNITKLANGLHAPQFIDNLPEDAKPVDTAGGTWRDLQAIDDGMTRAVHAADADDMLSAKGKTTAITAAAEKYRAEATKLKADHSEFVDKQVRKARRENTPESVDPNAAAIRAWETRNQIAERVGNDALEMKTLLSEAEAVGDVETLSAIADAQISWPQHALVEDHSALAETLATVHDTALGQDVAALIQADRELAPKFENVQNRLELIIDGEPDPVKKTAFGGGDDA
jgi:hypothetical protein